MPFVLFLLGAAGVALVASQSSGKGAKKPKPKPKGQTYTLDRNLPPHLREQVLAALATGKDPPSLESFASVLAPSYPLAAAALRQKAWELRGGPPLPIPRVIPDGPPPTPPSTNPLDLLNQIPDPPRGQVITMLATSNDPSALEAYAAQLDAAYPIAAAALRFKASMLGGQAPSPVPSPQPTPTQPRRACTGLPSSASRLRLILKLITC